MSIVDDILSHWDADKAVTKLRSHTNIIWFDPSRGIRSDFGQVCTASLREPMFRGEACAIALSSKEVDKIEGMRETHQLILRTFPFIKDQFLNWEDDFYDRPLIFNEKGSEGYTLKMAASQLLRWPIEQALSEGCRNTWALYNGKVPDLLAVQLGFNTKQRGKDTVQWVTYRNSNHWPLDYRNLLTDFTPVEVPTVACWGVSTRFCGMFKGKFNIDHITNLDKLIEEVNKEGS